MHVHDMNVYKYIEVLLCMQSLVIAVLYFKAKYVRMYTYIHACLCIILVCNYSLSVFRSICLYEA